MGGKTLTRPGSTNRGQATVEFAALGIAGLRSANSVRGARNETVQSLRSAGLSLRAIESATGISRPTVIKDLREAEVVNSLPPTAPEPVVDHETGEVLDYGVGR